MGGEREEPIHEKRDLLPGVIQLHCHGSQLPGQSRSHLPKRSSFPCPFLLEKEISFVRRISTEKLFWILGDSPPWRLHASLLLCNWAPGVKRFQIGCQSGLSLMRRELGHVEFFLLTIFILPS